MAGKTSYTQGKPGTTYPKKKKMAKKKATRPADRAGAMLGGMSGQAAKALRKARTRGM